MPQNLDAGSRLKGTFELVPPESEVETSARLENDAERRRHALWRERVTFMGALFTLALLLVFSLISISLPSATPEARELASQVLPALFTGLLGYFVGRRGAS